MSLGVYSMIALRRGSLKASEGALKYFLLGSFAAALQLFGAGLLYGATGHTDLEGIGQAIRTIGAADSAVSPTLVLSGLVLSVVGLAFKVGAVPFHMWTPDAYEGPPRRVRRCASRSASPAPTPRRTCVPASPPFSQGGLRRSGWRRRTRAGRSTTPENAEAGQTARRPCAHSG